MYVIETENLYKSFDGLAVLNGLDLRITEGQVYGLIGPNGAGKSTLIHLLLGFLKPTKGRISILGNANQAPLNERIGYLPERLTYHLRYTGREYLRYLGQFNDMREPLLKARVEQELSAVGLMAAADRRLATYSKGMLQRLGIAQALLADPDILLIDEPTSGLDPNGQREMLQLLGEVRARNHTILLTSHFLNEIEQICDTVGILFGGKLAAEIEVAALRTPGLNAMIKVADMTPALTEQLQHLDPAVHCSGREIYLQPNSTTLQAQVLRTLLDARIPIISLEPQGYPLEALYQRVLNGETIGSIDPPPPNGLFAPPGHPDAIAAEMHTNLVSPTEHTIDQAPAAAIVQPGRPSTGDTLLRELLKKEDAAGDAQEGRGP